MGRGYNQLKYDEKKKVLEYIVADDLGTIATTVLKTAGPALVNYFWDKLRNTTLF